MLMKNYPGIHFTPPEGSIDPEAEEGEAMVKWRKVGDKFTIVEFEGESLGSPMKEEMMEDKEESDYVSPEDDMTMAGL